MSTAVVKPDHLGDLVLSAAAIRALAERIPDLTILVASGNRRAAQYLFGPAAEIRAIDLPHLSKDVTQAGEAVRLMDFDQVVFLRHDGVLTPDWAEFRCRDYIFPIDSHEHHQSMLDYGVVAPLIGHYDVDRYQFGDHLGRVRQKAANPPRSVGLCIGSGFYANVWPVSRWLDFGRALRDQGRRVQVICGPREAGLGQALAVALGLAAEEVIIGNPSIEAFLDRVDELDWIVASDGGSAHLCALRAPVLSLFGPSPFRRYAPYGSWNRLLRRELDCSPCCQWAARLLNGCLSAECMMGITHLDAMAALAGPYGAGEAPGSVRLRDDLRLYEGVSHLGQNEKQAARLPSDPELLDVGMA